MTQYRTLYDGITKAAWGYFFLYFSININIDAGEVSLLPTFAGYILFLKTIDMLKQEERELTLLRTLGIVLTVWHIIEWISNCFALNLSGNLQFITIIKSLINLYFHFQLLTNLASIAQKYQQEGCEQDKKLLKYRTVQTIMLTAFLIISNFALISTEVWAYISFVLAIVYIVVCVLIMKALFDLRKCLRNDEETELDYDINQ